MPMPIMHARGERFGRLTIIQPVTGRVPTSFLCRCDCGSDAIVIGRRLRGGVTKSCGCLVRDLARSLPRDGHPVHGHTRAGKRSPTYISWQSMVARCTNPNRQEWPRYGGRGIQICERWRTFELFLADMGDRPAGTTLDRIDPEGNYEPGNVRWAANDVQARDHGRGPIAGLCRNGLHDITTPDSLIREPSGAVRCAECRRASKRAQRKRNKR